LVQPNQTVAIYMGLANLEELTAELIVRGARADMPAAVIDNATRPSQCVVAGTLATLAAKARSANLTGPAIVIVGSVVSLRQKLAAESEAAPQSERDPERAVAERATAPGEPTASLEIVEAW
jgi:uroporphyrin-III C-methyltransferase/precorrin-2 dehydrogenase/sirohydrochlorin ferrochelatase